jgi:hypothetical protein
MDPILFRLIILTSQRSDVRDGKRLGSRAISDRVETLQFARSRVRICWKTGRLAGSAIS